MCAFLILFNQTQNSVSKMSFKIGDNALFRYYEKSGYWSVIVREISITGESYTVETDGVVVPPPELRPYDPIGDEGCIINVYNSDLVKREPMSGDDEKRVLWAAKSAAIKAEIKKKADALKLRWAHIVPGKRVSWTEGGNYDGGTYNYKGVVTEVREEKWFIIDTGHSTVLKGGYDLTVL
jgi:hypothetical protein